jgi:hypothetical protein
MTTQELNKELTEGCLEEAGRRGRTRREILSKEVEARPQWLETEVGKIIAKLKQNEWAK